MTHTLDRRLTRLEVEQPRADRPYAIMPERCKTMEEWLTHKYLWPQGNAS